MKDLIQDSHIPLPNALIKFGKKIHMDNMYNYGQIHFSPAREFKKNGYDDTIYDTYEGELFYKANKIMIYPYNEIDGKYGKGIKLAEEGEIRTRNDDIDRIPFVSFFSYKGNIFNSLLFEDLFKDVLNEFKDYDTVTIIYKVEDFLKLLSSKKQIYVNNVSYVDETPDESIVVNGIHRIFYKRKKYLNQAEFRIALPLERCDIPLNVDFGKLSEYALVTPIDMLRKGVIISDDKDKAMALIEEYKKYGIKFDGPKNFEDQI